MNMHLRWLTILLLCLAWLLPSTYVRAGPPDRTPLQEGTATLEPEATTAEATSEPSALFPEDIIDAVNNLRVARGLPVLTVHPVLMRVAELQARALAASEGAIEHKRPCGIKLGQQLLSMGFPLRGDLTLDGYRSENWVMANSAEGAISFWLGDAPHTNTMLSPNRSHIGAAIAVSDYMYITLETAWATSSGEMQRGAEPILTALPSTQAACLGMSDQSGEGFWDLQYFAPVELSTAHPNGDVIHEVQNGQTLWSIAIDYDTTIEEVKRLNNLTSDTVAPGWTLLIVKGATQPVSSATPTFTIELTSQDLSTPTPWLSYAPTMTATTPPRETGQFAKQGRIVVITFVISFSVLLAAIIGLGRKLGIK
jgi:uncharacterized protein YkwD